MNERWSVNDFFLKFDHVYIAKEPVFAKGSQKVHDWEDELTLLPDVLSELFLLVYVGWLSKELNF